MNGTESEELITLKQAAASLPGRHGRGVSIASIWRWAGKGLRGIKLETKKVAGMRYTSREALQRFLEATAATERPQPTAPRTLRRRQRDIAAAEKQLDRAGFRRSTNNAHGSQR